MGAAGRGLRAAGVGLILAAVAAPPASAQGRGMSIFSLSAGPSHYDFSGTGTTYVVAGRIEGPVGSYAMVEPGVAFLSYKPDTGGRINYLLPEISLQGQVYAGPVRPYLGAGVGFASITNGPNLNKLTLHATAGGRMHLDGRWGMRLEVRARWIDPWHGSADPWHGRTADYTLGISRLMSGRGF